MQGCHVVMAHMPMLGGHRRCVCTPGESCGAATQTEGQPWCGDSRSWHFSLTRQLQQVARQAAQQRWGQPGGQCRPAGRQTGQLEGQSGRRAQGIPTQPGSPPPLPHHPAWQEAPPYAEQARGARTLLPAACARASHACRRAFRMHGCLAHAVG
jgi:hypothetical protein